MTEIASDGRKLRQATAQGAAFLIVQSFGSRVVLFGVQLILGWLLTPDDSLPGSPLDALKQGRKTEVRRRAQALAF